MPFPRKTDDPVVAYERFQSALDAVDITEAQRAAIYNAALDWNETVQEPAGPGLDVVRQRVTLETMDACVALVRQSLDTVRSMDDGESRSIKASIAAREHIIDLLTGYQAHVRNEFGKQVAARLSSGDAPVPET